MSHYSKIYINGDKLIVIDSRFKSGLFTVSAPAIFRRSDENCCYWRDKYNNYWNFNFGDNLDQSEHRSTRLSVYIWEQPNESFCNDPSFNYYFGLLNLRTTFLRHPEYKTIKHFMQEKLEEFDASGFGTLK